MPNCERLLAGAKLGMTNVFTHTRIFLFEITKTLRVDVALFLSLRGG
jgi:hypothetical protein